MPKIQLSIEVPEYTDDEIHAAVLAACVERVLGVYDDVEYEQGSFSIDPTESTITRVKRDGKFITDLRNEATALVQAKTREIVEARTGAIVDEALSGRFTPVDQFGNREPTTTLRSMIAKFGMEYLNCEVDDRGQPIRGYHNGPKRPRFHYLIDEAVKAVFAKELEDRVKQVTAEIKAGLSGKVSAKISETVLALLALPKASGT
jgi:hypothetical protein